MPSIRTQQRRAVVPRRGRPDRLAPPGRRFTRSGPASARTPRGRRQAAPGAADKLIGLVRRALPGGDSRGKRTGSPIPLVGGLLGPRHGASAQRGRKPALVGLLGADAAPDPQTAATSASLEREPGLGRAD